MPVKCRLTGASAGIANLTAKLTVTRTSNVPRGSVDCESDEDGDDTDFVFKYRKAKGLYSYRWKTVVHEVDVSLRAAPR